MDMEMEIEMGWDGDIAVTYCLEEVRVRETSWRDGS